MKHMLHIYQFGATYDARIKRMAEDRFSLGSLCCDDIDAETPSRPTLAAFAQRSPRRRAVLA
ncbi:MAG: hypothetical protein ACI4XG_20030, partial [Bradyrhizobium sp.]